MNVRNPLACACVAAAMAVVVGPASAEGSGDALRCSLDDAPATDCRMTDTVAADGTHRMEFVVGDKHVRFDGKSQTGWWSGQLDGRPAMGRELNRGHTVYSTTDLQSTFEWWSNGNEHGSY